MAIEIAYETHSTSVDNEQGIATGLFSDVPVRWDGQRILVAGHAATRWGLTLKKWLGLISPGSRVGSTGLSRSNFDRRHPTSPQRGVATGGLFRFDRRGLVPADWCSFCTLAYSPIG